MKGKEGENIKTYYNPLKLAAQASTSAVIY
jgi:hypothetical protein